MSEWTLDRKLSQRRGKLSVPTPPVPQPRATSGSVTTIALAGKDKAVMTPVIDTEIVQSDLDMIMKLTDSIKAGRIYIENPEIRTAMKRLVGAWFKRFSTWERSQKRK